MKSNLVLVAIIPLTSVVCGAILISNGVQLRETVALLLISDVIVVVALLAGFRIRNRRRSGPPKP